MQLLTGATRSGAGAEECARQLIDTIPTVMTFIRRQMRSSSPAELSVAQLRTLYFISRHDRPSLSAASDFIGLSLPAMSRLVDALVRAELVTRTSCPKDRRHIRLGVTPLGQSALDVALKGTRDRVTREVSSLTGEQRQTLNSALELLRSIFEPQRVKD